MNIGETYMTYLDLCKFEETNLSYINLAWPMEPTEPILGYVT